MKANELKKDAIPVLKQIGFSDEEAGLMTLGAINHQQFTQDMSLEGFISIALKMKGQSM